ncbi:hypothetical protein HDU89_003691 [Geranomyces variabilis]|nr:hypothetical protein HDU89_003691 [Geranomyces variabilis]
MGSNGGRPLQELVENHVPASKTSVWAREFLNDRKHGGNCLRTTLLWKGDEIIGSVMLGQYAYATTQKDYAPAVLAVKNIVSQADLDAFEMGTYDALFLSFTRMHMDAIIMFGAFLAGTVAMNLAFFKHARATLLIIPIVVRTMLKVLAALPALRIPHNPVVVAILGMSITITNDFSGYVQQSF